MVAELQLRGVYVPLVTPFDPRGDVDLDALEHLTDEVLSAGAAGVVALATTGEPTSLDDAERDAVVLAGEVTPGRAHAEALLPLVRALFAEPSPAVIKALLHAEGRIPTADVRMPLSNASATAVKRALAVRPV